MRDDDGPGPSTHVSAFRADEIWQGYCSAGPTRRVALTIDTEHPDRVQCPPGNLEHMLEVLAAEGVPATFFLQGRWVTAHPDAARAIAAGGHLVGNHSNYHAKMPLLTDAGIAADVTDAEVAIKQATGQDPKPWFRCPFGAGHDDQRVRAALARLGYRNAHWDVWAQDWENGQTAEGVRTAVRGGVEGRHVDTVVLLHSWPAPTGQALAAMVSDLRDMGARLVTLDEVGT